MGPWERWLFALWAWEVWAGLCGLLVWIEALTS